MAKYPAPGRVKTRLAAAIGDEAAGALCRAFILDLHHRLRGLPWPVTWAYWPPDTDFAALVPGARCRPQRGDDLGQRMMEAAAAELTAGAAAAILIGADVPHVPIEVLGEASEALGAGADVVVGPAADGGYYLIGVRAAHPVLFDGIAWGTPAVLAATHARALAAGLDVRLLPAGFDVDDHDDLVRLRTLIAEAKVALPRTASVLASLPAGCS